MKTDKTEPCVCCRKVWNRDETDKYVYHVSRGYVCLDHHGVAKWYKELLDKANKELKELGIN